MSFSTPLLNPLRRVEEVLSLIGLYFDKLLYNIEAPVGADATPNSGCLPIWHQTQSTDTLPTYAISNGELHPSNSAQA